MGTVSVASKTSEGKVVVAVLTASNKYNLSD